MTWKIVWLCSLRFQKADLGKVCVYYFKMWFLNRNQAGHWFAHASTARVTCVPTWESMTCVPDAGYLSRLFFNTAQCVHVFIYVLVCVYMYVYLYIYIYICIHTYIHMRMYILLVQVTCLMFFFNAARLRARTHIYI